MVDPPRELRGELAGSNVSARQSFVPGRWTCVYSNGGKEIWTEVSAW